MDYFQGKNPDAYLQVALGHLHVRGDGDLGLLASDGHHFAQLTGLAVNLDAVVEKLLLKIKPGVKHTLALSAMSVRSWISQKSQR